ncbi:Rieske 2Fe-2S domain-containing protein [Iningainema sp. BLCCT55]|uniref:Rieske 2Fe-2S domain-containing protein n=2 Tax=Iningainema TaxID=1932705 RepID=A0A8J7C8L7_9CYAN|nr:Rieske 2Fe-2S domain-containing protein [Iningainema tapete]MBD2776939.1 Rieske 2Fe-2S domain-containing protein [Iningainema tapete BLCC-T55]
MLPGVPWLLAHRSMLKPNQPMKVSLYANDYVLWQDSLGKISCLPNACPHMGAMLSEGWCVTKPDGSSVVACPFHALEFDSAGCTVLPGSNKPTKSLIEPLELIIQGDFIWSYGGEEPKAPIPTTLNEIASEYEFVGYVADISVKTDLLTMLLNMHDYNHQNGTHRPLFEIEEVQFNQFIDDGHHSHAYFDLPRTKPTLSDILKNPGLLVLPKVIQVHLENCFPSMVIVHAHSPMATVRECHLFVPESPNHTRTYVLVFMKVHNPIFHLFKRNLLHLASVIVKQDAEILEKLYSNTPQHIKLNNEVGMEWVRRNFESFPTVVQPNLSRAEVNYNFEQLHVGTRSR